MIKMAPVQYDTIILDGGLDLITPTLRLKPGVLSDSSNFEVAVAGGYARIEGYERFDGQAAPSSATIDATGDFRADAISRAAAANVLRALIQPVPGSGPVRGFVYFSKLSEGYAFRDNVGGTACAMFKSSPTGWQAIALGSEIAFINGATPVSDGDTINNGSGATATVARVVRETGSWLSSDATGRLVLSASVGTWTTGDPINVGATHCADAASSVTAITLAPGGRYEFDIGGFSGQAYDVRVYGCDGVNRPFEFDGTTFVPLNPGVYAKFIKVHRGHLFVTRDASVINSAIGNPYDWTAINGSAEIAVGDTITGLLVQPGSQETGAMSVHSRNSTYVLYGSSSADWKLVTYNNGIGAIAYTTQNMAQSYVLDDRGVVSLQATLAYGNFEQATLTHHIQPFINNKRRRAIASTVQRAKSQYRIFFDDGAGLYVTIVNSQFAGAMPVYFPDAVSCTWESETETGETASWAGLDSGYVVRLDKGTSFDGARIPASFTTTYNATGNSRQLKRYRKMALEAQGTGYAEFSVNYLLGYGTNDIRQGDYETVGVPLASARWDEFDWDEFIWDGYSLLPAECELNGTAENIAVRVRSNSDFVSTFTLNSMIIHFTGRRGLR